MSNKILKVNVLYALSMCYMHYQCAICIINVLYALSMCRLVCIINVRAPLGRECDSNHTILSTQKGPLGSENYFFTLFGQEWAILGGVPRLEEGVSGENDGAEG